MLGTDGYKQIDGLIREELAMAERLLSSLETERPLEGAKGGLFRLPASQRVVLWRALAKRLKTDGSVPSDEEQSALWREYEWAMATQARLTRRVAWYQIGVLLFMGAFAVTLVELANLPNSLDSIDTIIPYILASFWGAVGGATSSLWQLLQDVEERALSATGAPGHYLKPILGSVLGLMVSLILPSNLLDVTGSTINLTGYALAALAGLSERTFITKLQQLLDAVLGGAIAQRSGTKTGAGGGGAQVVKVTTDAQPQPPAQAPATQVAAAASTNESA